MPACAGPITFVKDSPFRGRAALPIGHEWWTSFGLLCRADEGVRLPMCDRGGAVHCGLTLWPMAQTNPESSRASATTILL